MEIKRFGNIEGKTMMILLHGNLMCWWQFEDLNPLEERKCACMPSLRRLMEPVKRLHDCRDQADKLAAYIEKDLDGQLDRFLQSRCARRCFSEGFPNRSD